MTFRTGQVATMLGISVHHVRRLCEAGLITGRVSDGNRWRIPATEVERLRAEGVPPIPQLEDDTADRGPAKPVPTRPDVPAPPTDGPDTLSPAVSPEVREEHDNCAIAETKLKRRKIELELEDVEESFRDRSRRRSATEQEQRQRQEAAEAQTAREVWVNRWVEYALFLVPYDAAECRSQACQLAQNALRTISVEVSPWTVRQLMEGAVSQALAPYHRRKRLDEAVRQAIQEALPYSARSERIGVEAKQAAQEAAARSADPPSMLAAAQAAVAPFATRFRDAEARRGILDSVRAWAWGEATEEERQEAEEAVVEALQRLPMGTARGRLEKAKDAALEPLEATLRERKEKTQRRQTAEQAADQALWLVGSYLGQNCSFDSLFQQFETERELKARLREVLVKRILSGRLAPAEVSDYIEEWLDGWMEDQEAEDES